MPRKPKPPTASVIRSLLLKRIREARFPQDATQFKPDELRGAGLWDKYQRPPDMVENSFKLLVLLSTQANELRTERDRLRQKLGELQPYFSPLRWQAIREPDPVKSAKLNRQAGVDEARITREMAKKKQADEENIRRFTDQITSRPWSRRDTSSMPHAVFWHEPMTIPDYGYATGLVRRTLHNIVHRLKAKPLARPTRKNMPLRYGTQTNYAIFSEWLLKYEQSYERRRAWLVRTWLKYYHEKPDCLSASIEGTTKVYASLKLDTPAKSRDFLDYVEECDRILFPPLPPMPAALQALLAPIFTNSPVGKNG